MGFNANKWDPFYKDLEKGKPGHYIDTATYRMGVDFLSDCKIVEDWGCGKGWFAYKAGDTFKVVGIDGSQTPFADRVVDLEDYVSKVDGIFIRGVIEHNYNWDIILENALKSANKKLFLAIFTPMEKGDKAIEIDFVSSYQVPDLSLPTAVLEKMLSKYGTFTKEEIESDTAYHVETIYRVTK